MTIDRVELVVITPLDAMKFLIMRLSATIEFIAMNFYTNIHGAERQKGVLVNNKKTSVSIMDS